MKIFFAIATLVFITACSHPLEIIGEGNIVSSTGTRNCSLEQQPCDNYVLSDYQEKFSAIPRLGWHFVGWEGCGDQFPDCSINVPGRIVFQHWGDSIPPLQAVFAKDTPPPIAPPRPEEVIVGEISRIGELDEHKFTLSSGDAIHIRVSDSNGDAFVPEIWLYKPDGTVLQHTRNNTTVEFNCNPGVSCKIDQSGEYRLVIGDLSSDHTGSYEIHFVNVLKSNANGA
jgi:hypothetical protein